MNEPSIDRTCENDYHLWDGSCCDRGAYLQDVKRSDHPDCECPSGAIDPEGDCPMHGRDAG